jgi:hypothetical protein
MGNHALRIVQKYHPHVMSVVDGKAPIKIKVTEQDCRNGKVKGPSSCAMARAFERTYDGAIISLSTAYLIKGDKAFRYLVPDSVSREIVSFDRNKNFAPGTYHLAKIEPARALGVKRTKPINRTDPTKYKKAKRKYHKTAGIRAL